jgi:hypothetical protein
MSNQTNTSTSETTAELKKELTKSLGLLKTLRDEIRVEVHLAGMDAKDEWNKKIEPHLAEVEQAARDASAASQTAVRDAMKRLQTFHASFSKKA